MLPRLSQLQPGEAASARPTMSASSARASPGCGAAGRLGVSSNAGALCITGAVAGMAAGMLVVGMAAGTTSTRLPRMRPSPSRQRSTWRSPTKQRQSTPSQRWRAGMLPRLSQLQPGEAASARPTMSASSARASPGCGAAGRLGVSSSAGALCITGLVAGVELFFGAAT